MRWLADSWRRVLIKCWLCFLPGLIRFLINFPRWLSELRCHIKVLWALDLSEGKKRLWLIQRLISHHWWCITLINCGTRFTNQHLKNIMHFCSLLLYDRWTFEWTVNSQQAAVPALHLQDSINASCCFFLLKKSSKYGKISHLSFWEIKIFCRLCKKKKNVCKCLSYILTAWGMFLIVFPDGQVVKYINIFKYLSLSN